MMTDGTKKLMKSLPFIEREIHFHGLCPVSLTFIHKGKSKARNGCTALLTEASNMRRLFVYSDYSRPFYKYIDKSLILSHRT